MRYALAVTQNTKNAPPHRVLEFIRLMWAVDHELQRVSKRMVSQIGLTAPQRLALRFIGLQPQLTLGELAAVLHRTRAPSQAS